MKLLVGSAIPLMLSLKGQNDATGVIVRAIIRNPAGTQVGSTITLTHIGEGLFTDQSVNMPDSDFVSVRYLIFEGDGTTPHPAYLSASEIFLRDTIAAQVWDKDLASHTTSGSAGKALLDNQTEHDATQTAIGNLNDLDATEVEAASTAALDAQGYSEARAILLDNLDAAISSISSGGGITIEDVQEAMDNQGYTALRAELLDNLDVAVSSVSSGGGSIDIDGVKQALDEQGYTTPRAEKLDLIGTGANNDPVFSEDETDTSQIIVGSDLG